MKSYLNDYLWMWRLGLNTNDSTDRKTFFRASIIQLSVFLLIILLGFIESLLSITDLRMISTVIFVLYFVASFVPYSSLMMRRLNDATFSRLYYYFIFLPLIGWILLGFALFTKTLKK